MRIILTIALSMACGFKPFPPMGCPDAQFLCICDSNNDCNWVTICE